MIKDNKNGGRTSGTVKPNKSMTQTGSIKVNKNGSFSGWDSIFSQLNSQDRIRAQEIEKGMQPGTIGGSGLKPAPADNKRVYWNVS
jgi:hypothetical protein